MTTVTAAIMTMASFIPGVTIFFICFMSMRNTWALRGPYVQ